MTAEQRLDSDDFVPTIRVADLLGDRSFAHILVNKMYQARGYSVLPETQNTNRVTLIAMDHGVTIGTITVGFDGPGGLVVEDIFAKEVRGLRDAGHRVCEFTKLAIEPEVKSKKVLIALMQAAFICGREIHGCTTCVIEVNPRHARFYQAMLGFSLLAGERHNKRVNAPAVLMALDLAFAAEKIENFHQQDSTRSDRSLYRHSLSPQQSSVEAERLTAKVAI